ncbi:hypothetical protein BH09CHL1_BH09CHL1_11600 [soil metagenome]
MPWVVDSTYKQPEDPTTRIWHYLRHGRFVQLLQSQSLWFRSVREYEDKFEASFPDVDPEYRENDTLDRTIFVTSETMARGKYDGNDSFVTYSHCWTLRAYESVAMWQLYVANPPDNAGLAICSTLAGMKSAFESAQWNGNDVEVRIGKVDYYDYSAAITIPGAEYQPHLCKNLPFEYEREMRAIVHPVTQENCPNFDDRPRGVPIACNLSDLIQSIVVAPRSSDAYLLNVESALAAANLKNVPVRRSQLDEKPRRVL